MYPLTSATNDTSQPIVLLTTSHELEKLLQRAASLAVAEYEAKTKTEKRLTSAEAAHELGCSLSHLQTLHRQGLPYEKGRPNFYKLSDLEAFRETRRLQLTQ